MTAQDGGTAAAANNELLVAYYGDDFTGSTDVMEVLECAGIPTMLFVRPPTQADLAAVPDGIRAVGVAGMSRTMSVTELDAHLPAMFQVLAATGASIIHYKTCSTFDSSPTVGSIGRALELGSQAFAPGAIPLVVGSPDLGRYCVFGQLYAKAAGRVHRLDRHPTLPDHPVTPMRESDLLRHLALQTDLPAASFSVLDLAEPPRERARRYRALLEDRNCVVLFDVLTDAHLRAIGALLWELRQAPMKFVAGSSGVESALVAQWRSEGMIPVSPNAMVAGEASSILVLSGSCSAATRAQVEQAVAVGYDARRLSASGAAADVTRASDWACRQLESTGRALVYTALGPDDCAQAGDPAAYGEVLAEVAAEVLARIRPDRLVVAGGDTSGRVARRLGIDALRVVAPIAPGSPLCRATSTHPAAHGLEIALKGGQVGGPGYFEQVRRGRA